MTYTYDTLKISKTMRVDGLYDYNSEANDETAEGNLVMGQDLKNPTTIENKVSFSKSGYVDNKWLVSENGQIFKVSSVLAKKSGKLVSHKTGFAATEFRVDPEEIGLVFQNKAAPAEDSAPANNEFANFIYDVSNSYYDNWNALFFTDTRAPGGFTRPESINTPIDTAALRTALNEANPSLLKVFNIIFKAEVVTANKKLIEETDLYLRYLNKGIALAETGDAKYKILGLESLKGSVATLDPWYKGLKEKAADTTSTSDAELVTLAVDQLTGTSRDNDASNNVITVLAVGEAPVTGVADAVDTGNEPDWKDAYAVADHFNQLLFVIRDNGNIATPANLKDKEGANATAINNFTVINKGGNLKLVTTDGELPKDPGDMTAADWSTTEWHPVKIDFDGFEGYQNKRVNFGKKDATDEKSKIRILDRYLHDLANIAYGSAIGGEDAIEPDADVVVTAPAAVALPPPVTHRAFNGFTKANETLTALTTKPENQTGVTAETPITKFKPASNNDDEYGVVDQDDKPIMIDGKSYPDITSLLIILGQLTLAEKVVSDADLGKVTDGLILAIGVTAQKQYYEDQVVKVDFGAVTLAAKEDAKIKAVAQFVADHPEIVGVEIWGNADGDNADLKYSKFRMEKGTERFGVHMAAIGGSVTITGHQNSNSTAARRGVTFSFTVSDTSTGPDVSTVDYFLVPVLENYVTAKRDAATSPAVLQARADEIVEVVEDLTDLNELKIATKLHGNLKKIYGDDDPLVKSLAAHIITIHQVLVESGVLAKATLGDASFSLTNDETQFAVGGRYVTFPFTGDASGIKVVDDWGQDKARKFTSANGVLKINLGFAATTAGEYALIITTAQGTKINVIAVASGSSSSSSSSSSGGSSGSSSGSSTGSGGSGSSSSTVTSGGGNGD